MVSLKIFVVSLFVLIALALSAISASAADAKTSDKVVQISRVSAYSSDSDIIVSVSLKAGGKLTDAKITVSVPELGIRSSNRVDFSKKKKQAVSVEMPAPDEFGQFDHYLRIVFSSDEGRRVKFRPVIFQ